MRASRPSVRCDSGHCFDRCDKPALLTRNRVLVHDPLVGDRIDAALRLLELRLGGVLVAGGAAPLGISGLVCRVTRIQPGEIRNNRIVIEAAEDVYGIDRAVFSAVA